MGFLGGCQVLVPRCGSSSWHMRWLLVLKPFISFELVLRRIPLHAFLINITLALISYRYSFTHPEMTAAKSLHTQENYMGKGVRQRFWCKFMSCTVVFKFQRKWDVICLCFLILIGNKRENSTKFVRWDKTRSAIKGKNSLWQHYCHNSETVKAI